MNIIYVLSLIALIAFNLGNVYIDAYRILKHRTIAHGVNLTAYIIFTILDHYLFFKPDISLSGFPYLNFILFLFTSFFNRQLSFDIPLNIRRGLKWDYVSLDRPPKAWLDRQEVRVFGYNGKLINIFYMCCFIICLLIKIFL